MTGRTSLSGLAIVGLTPPVKTRVSFDRLGHPIVVNASPTTASVASFNGFFSYFHKVILHTTKKEQVFVSF